MKEEPEHNQKHTSIHNYIVLSRACCQFPTRPCNESITKQQQSLQGCSTG